MCGWNPCDLADSRNSLDLEMPGPTVWRKLETVQRAVADGLVTEEAINDRVLAVLKLLERAGRFSKDAPSTEERAVDLPKHRQVIRKAGAEGAVLLKNESSILPIDPTKYRKIALLGPLAESAAAHGGGSASLNSHYKISPVEAIASRLSSDHELLVGKGQSS